MRLGQILGVTIIALAATCGGADAGAVFDGGVQGAPGFSYFPLWARVIQSMRADHDDGAMDSAVPAVPALPPTASPLPGGQSTSPAACSDQCADGRWDSFLQSIRKLSRRRQLDAVNRWANAKPYIEDWVNWGVPDYWETPAEFIRRGGDCEDYAIAKYFSLVRLGFSPDNLRIVIVNDRNLQAFHAVLAVRQAAQTWLLDNAVPDIVPMEVAVQYAPIYSLNERSWWLYSAPRIVVSDASLAENGPAAGSRPMTAPRPARPQPKAPAGPHPVPATRDGILRGPDARKQNKLATAGRVARA